MQAYVLYREYAGLLPSESVLSVYLILTAISLDYPLYYFNTSESFPESCQTSHKRLGSMMSKI